MSSTQHSSLERGQGLVEYALILALVAVVVIAVLAMMGPSVGNTFSNVVAHLNSAQASASAPSFADLSAAVAGCVTHNGARHALTNAADHNDLSGFNHQLDVHQSKLSASCHAQLSDMASRMA